MCRLPTYRLDNTIENRNREEAVFDMPFYSVPSSRSHLESFQDDFSIFDRRDMCRFAHFQAVISPTGSTPLLIISPFPSSNMADNFDIEEYLEEQVTKPAENVAEEDKKSRYFKK